MSDRNEHVRDRLPELAAGLLGAVEAAEVRAHLEACAECAAEYGLVRLLRTDTVAVPPGLDARIGAALARGARARPRWVSPGRLAMAATVVLALVTASLLDGPSGPDPQVAADPGVEADPEALTAPAWPAVEEPLMRGGPALYQLSVDELESLLKELDS